MSQSILCGLCLNTCTDHKNIHHDEDAFNIISSFFFPKFLNKLSAVCQPCLSLISEFYNYLNQTILKQRKLDSDNGNEIILKFTLIEKKNAINDHAKTLESKKSMQNDGLSKTAVEVNAASDTILAATPLKDVVIKQEITTEFANESTSTCGSLSTNNKKTNEDPAQSNCLQVPADLDTSQDKMDCSEANIVVKNEVLLNSESEEDLELVDNETDNYYVVEYEMDTSETDEKFTLGDDIIKEETIISNMQQVETAPLAVVAEESPHSSSSVGKICNVCDKAFLSLQHLKDHMTYHTDIPLYQCMACSLKFKYRPGLHAHLTKQHPTEWAMRNDIVNFWETMRIPNEPNSKIVPGKVATTKFFDDMRKWRNTLDCPLCMEQQLFATWSALKTHFKEEHANENCHTICCKIKFYHIEYLTDHARLHVDPDCMTCKFCGQSFTKSTNFRRHLRDEHRDAALTIKEDTNGVRKSIEEFDADIAKWKSTLNCGVCNEAHANFSQLTQHFLSLHPNQRAYILCCEYKLSDRDKIADHALYHENPNTFKCFKCGKCCPHHQALYSHMWTRHSTKSTGESFEKKVYKCSECGHTFGRARALREHMAMHKGEDLYKCAICSKTSKYYANIHTHLKITHPQEFAENSKSSAARIKLILNLNEQ